jgi:protein SCO1
MMRHRKLTIIFVMGLVAIAALAVSLYTRMDNVAQSRTASLGGPFTLTDDTGKPVTEASLMGKPSVIYFGYTFCPEVCPTTLLDLTHLIAKLGPDADKANYVFVTIDPQRDTVKAMHDYVSSFDKRIRGYTGTAQQVAQIAKAYGVYYAREPGGGENYAMDHSTRVYLMDAKGHYVESIAYQEPEASALSKLKRLLAS